MKKLVYYAGLYTVSAGLLKLVGFVLFMWMARTLSVDDYASFGLLYSLQTGLITFGLVGIVEAVVGLLKEHKTEEKQRELFVAANSSFLITLACAIVFTLFLFLIFFKHSSVSFFTLVSVLVSGSVLAFASLQAQIVRLEEKHFSSLCFSFVLPFSGLVGSIIAFLFEGTVQSFFFGSAIGAFISLAGLRINRVGFYSIVDRMREARPILLRITPFIAIAFFGWLNGYGNNYVIKFFFIPKEVAKFTFAFSLSAIMSLIATALNQVWSPRFYRLIHELPSEQVERKNQRFYFLQSITMGMFGGGVIAIFPYVISKLGGNLSYYQSMSFELFCLFSAYVFLTPWWHCNNYYLAYDKGPSVMRVVLITSVIGIFVWLILMWVLGPIGIYIGFLVQMIFRSMGILIAAKKHWSIKISWGGLAAGVFFTFIGFVFSRM